LTGSAWPAWWTRLPAWWCPPRSATAAGAADIVSVLSLLSSELGADDGLEDVMVTFGSRFHLIRHVRADSAQPVVLLVVLDRSRANLAMARREIREFCEGMAS
jgi:hypothetical protein